MFGNLFTLDYEIHGNGDGSPHKLMVEPTKRMLELFDQYGAKLTIMADVGEILKFKEYLEETGNDRFGYQQIVDQLRTALVSGHDVQLHIHPSYFKSRFVDDRWAQDWSEYSLAHLEYSRLESIISTCKSFLEETIGTAIDDYKCIVFRAGNWSMYPSHNIVNALIKNDILVDTSVFKYGKRQGRVSFNYKDAYSDLIPWAVNEDDICKKDVSGKLLEIPIYAENRKIWSFFSVQRIFRVIQASRHKHPRTAEQGNDKSQQLPVNLNKLNKIRSLFANKHAFKMDFNQCTGKELIRMLKRIEAKYGHLEMKLPVVLIGHSKLYTKLNAMSLEPFLEFIARNQDKYCFSTFKEFDLDQFKNLDLPE